MTILDAILGGAKVACLCAVAWLACESARFVAASRPVIRILPATVDAAIAREAAALRLDLRDESVRYRALLQQQASGLRGDVTARLDDAISVADGHLTSIEMESAAVLRQSVSTMQAATMELALTGTAGRAVLLKADAGLLEAGRRLDPWTACEGNGGCYQAQLGAAFGSARSALGQVARSAPRVADSLEKSALQSERATAETANFMHNAAELAKPLPRWLRIPLQLITPAAPFVIQTVR